MSKSKPDTCHFSCHNPPKFVLYFRKENADTGLHILTTARGRPIYNTCLQCATSQAIENDDDIIGVLSLGEAKNYVKSCKKSSPHHELYTNGVVVVDPSSTSLEFFDLTCFTNQFMTNASVKDLKRLNNTTRYEEGIDYKESSFKLWKNIYTEGSTPRKFNKIPNLLSPIRRNLERVIFPHEYFARLARNRVKIEHGGNHIKEVSLKDDNDSIAIVKKSPDILELKKLNFFVRGRGLDLPQDMHIDSTTITVEAILVVKGSEYQFRYIPQSHKLYDNHDINMRLDESKIEIITAKPGQYICFFDTTIHSGGLPSPQSTHQLDQQFMNCFGPEYPNEIPTDLSYQLTLEHSGRTIAGYNGEGKVFAYRHKAVETLDKVRFRLYVEKHSDDFENDITAAKDGYFELLSDRKTPHTKRRRKAVDYREY